MGRRDMCAGARHGGRAGGWQSAVEVSRVMGGTAGMRACLVRTPASSRRAARQAEERLPSLAGGLGQRSSLWGGAPVAEVDGDSVSRSQELVERGCSDVVSKPAGEEMPSDYLLNCVSLESWSMSAEIQSSPD